MQDERGKCVVAAPAEELKAAVLAIAVDTQAAADRERKLRALVQEMQESLRFLHGAAKGASAVDADTVENMCGDYLAPTLVEDYLAREP